MYPEGWDKNMKRSVRNFSRRADRVIMRGVQGMYKNSDEVRIIQSREEQMRVLEV